MDYRNVDIMADKEFMRIYSKCKEFTMTSIERMYALYHAVKYVTLSKIKGDIVECGVWKGGSMMLAAMILKKMKVTSRRIFLYDTFEGMSPPRNIDRDFMKKKAKDYLAKEEKLNGPVWSYASLEEVKANMNKTGYPDDNMIFVKGMVEKTIPLYSPWKIALLRLDTDWYSSTLHELNTLYPRLQKKGILIIDDYGHWQGCRRAVDEYFSEKRPVTFFIRIDYTGRLMVK